MANPLRVLVIGTGSIGKRHMANLRTLGAEVWAYSYRVESRAELERLGLSNRTFDTLEEALEARPEAVVVANRTDQHLEVALEALRRSLPVLLEKPLSHDFHGMDRWVEQAESSKSVIEVGFMMRFHPALQAVKKVLETNRLGQLLSARFLCGQYLPDWRPNQDHREGYGARRETGGGALLDLSHELDLACWFFGEPQAVQAMLAKTGDLDIETETIAQLGIRFGSGVLAQVHLDYLRPRFGRSFEIVGSQGILNWDYERPQLTLTDREGQITILHETLQPFERNAMFLAQMALFLERVKDPTLAAGVSLADGVQAQRLAMAAHRSDREGRTVETKEIQ